MLLPTLFVTMLLPTLFVTIIKDTISCLLNRDNSRHLEIKNPRANYEQIRSVYTLVYKFI